MKIQLECFPCFFKQTLIAARLGTTDEALQAAVLKGVTEEIQAADMSRSPAYSTTFIHRKIRRLLGKDPFREIKSEYNRIALGLSPELSATVRRSSDPLETVARLAIAGNIIDFGIFSSVDILGTVERALSGPLAVDHYQRFKEAVHAHAEVLYLLDNAGELVFDRLLIEVLLALGKRVTVAVKGFPVLNDATREDAVEAGLADLVPVIDNGSDCIGTILDMTSPDFNRAFAAAPLVISKGQANFETLWDTPTALRAPGGVEDRSDRIFFLLQSKCDVVSKVLDLPKGAMLLMSADALP